VSAINRNHCPPSPESALDTRTYAKGIKISKAQMRTLDIRGDKFHPEWNYTVHPRLPKS